MERRARLVVAALLPACALGATAAAAQLGTPQARPTPALAGQATKPADPGAAGGSYLGGTCPQGQTTLCIPLDASFSVVQFDGIGGSGPADPNDSCQRNDDDVSTAIPLGWSFDLFGTLWTDVYINNNGNLTFGAPFATFTPTGFPLAGTPMVAPFWGDVDTGDILDTFGGVVYYRLESIGGGDSVNRLTVTWDHVGYYNEHGDLLNTFQVIITDGNDPLVGLGNNVCFCYDDMQWTTGDASGGVGGFGGSPATVGVNHGNGVDFFQIGLFDHPGNDWDGPGGSTDGVSFLDGSATCFNVGVGGTNAPPIFVNPPQGCLQVSTGETLMFTIEATGPEAAQTVNLVVDSHGLANFSCVVTPGNPATAVCTFTPDGTQLGTFNIDYVAVDDFNPPATSNLRVCIEVAECYLLMGFAAADEPMPFGDVEDRLLVRTQRVWPVTLVDIPDLVVPDVPGMVYARFYFQVYMRNPAFDPQDPVKVSNGLEVRVNGPSVPYGQETGIQLFNVGSNDLGGSLGIRFTIDGM